MFDVKVFRSPAALKHYLNGGLQIGTLQEPINSIHGWPNLVGKTLIFNTPAATVTFVDGDFARPDNVATFKEVKTKVEATVAGVVLLLDNKTVWAVETNPTNGITIDKDGTANPILGLSPAADMANVVHTGIGAASGLYQFATNNGGELVAVMKDAAV